jgi:hypothetical protein
VKAGQVYFANRLVSHFYGRRSGIRVEADSISTKQTKLTNKAGWLTVARPMRLVLHKLWIGSRLESTIQPWFAASEPQLKCNVSCVGVYHGKARLQMDGVSKDREIREDAFEPRRLSGWARLPLIPVGGLSPTGVCDENTPQYHGGR